MNEIQTNTRRLSPSRFFISLLKWEIPDRLPADLEIQRICLGHFMGARLVGGGVGLDVVGGDDSLGEHVGFDFIAADVGKHGAIDFDAGAEHLTAFLDHFLALQGIVDDVAIFEGEIVFAHDGANSLAPSTGGFQVGTDFWIFHN